MASLIGKEIGKYRITERIGRGGMADVYRGIHTHLDRPVAVKVLHGHLMEGGDFIERFKREAKAVANLRHPNIVQVHDFDIQGDLIFMVMEYIDGTNLQQKLVELDKTGERLPITQIASIVSDIAAALDYAHSQGMLHRDVKPSNIMLDGDGKAYLTDFGIAKIVGDNKLTATGTLIGTPAYMSPEQGRGEELTEESDIYSLGIVAFELLTGRVPYDAKTPIGIVHKQISEPVPRITELVDGVPVSAQDVIDRALAKTPEGRFSSAVELTGALRLALEALEATEDVLVQPTIEMDPAEQEKLSAPTMTMEPEGTDEETSPEKRKSQEGDSKKAAVDKEQAQKKIPGWAYIAGVVVLLAAGVLILTRLLGVGPLIRGSADLPEGAVQVRVEANREGEGVDIFSNPEDGNYNLVQIDGEWAWETGTGRVFESENGNQDQDFYLYFDIDDRDIYLVPCCGKEIYIDVVYRDHGSDKFRLEYDSYDTSWPAEGAFTATNPIVKTDTGKFRTARFTLVDPKLANGQGGADFRIWDGIDGAETIREISVTWIPESAQTEEESAGEELFQEGIELREAGDYEQALVVMEQALEAGYDDQELLVQLGATRRDVGDYYGAIEVLQEATERDPDNTAAWFSLAESYYNTGEDQYKDEAHQAMDIVLEAEPDNPNAHWLIGVIRLERFGNPEDAIQDFTRAIELDPNASLFYHMRASAYQEIGQWTFCIADENEAIDLGFTNQISDDPFSYLRRGECYLEVGEPEQTRADYERFLEMTEGEPDLIDVRREVQEWLDAN